MLNHQMVVVLWSETDTHTPVHEQPHASGIYKNVASVSAPRMHTWEKTKNVRKQEL